MKKKIRKEIIKYSDSRYEEFIYNEDGKLITHKVNQNNGIDYIKHYVYNDKGLLTKEYDNLGNERILIYNKSDKLIYAHHSNGYEEYHVYDENNNLIYSKKGTYLSYFNYDDKGNMVYSIANNGNWTKYEYDEYNNIISFEKNIGVSYTKSYEYYESNNNQHEELVADTEDINSDNEGFRNFICPECNKGSLLHDDENNILSCDNCSEKFISDRVFYRSEESGFTFIDIKKYNSSLHDKEIKKSLYIKCECGGVIKLKDSIEIIDGYKRKTREIYCECCGMRYSDISVNYNNLTYKINK